MGQPFCLDDVLDAMAAADSLDGMTKLLYEIRDTYGLANLVYCAASLPGCEIPNPILLLSYEEAWVKRYLTEDYFSVDPVARQGLRGFLPFDWSSVPRDTTAVRHFFREAESYGVGTHGVTIPIRGPNNERALLAATCNVSDREWQDRRPDFLRDFHAMAHFFHDRAAYLSGQRTEPPPRLSNREQQCIQMIAMGHQPKAIARILGISEPAIRLYTKSARHKLRCATLAQAVARAVKLDLIEA